MEDQQFIHQTLEEYARYLDENFSRDIARQQLVNTGDLLSSLKYNARADDKGGILSFTFKTYGRFQDMGAGRKTEDAEDILFPRQKGSKTRRKPKPWYNKNLFGSMNRLIRALMYGYADFSIKKTRNTLKKSM